MPTLREFFAADFSHTMKVAREVSVATDGDSKTTVIVQVHLDHRTGGKFLAAYLPCGSNSLARAAGLIDVAAHLVRQHKEYLKDDIHAGMKYPADEDWIQSAELKFTGFFYIYTEAQFEQSECQRLQTFASTLDIKIVIRGPNYATTRGEVMTTAKSIFLSHSSKDKFFVRELATKLRGAGARVWLDEAEIRVGDSLTDKIGAGLEEADYVGAILSAASINSTWVQKELQVALQKEIRGRKVVVLPILLEPVQIPPFLLDKVYADFTSPDRADDSFKQLLRAIGLQDNSTGAFSPSADKIRASLDDVPKAPERRIRLDARTQPPDEMTHPRLLETFVDIMIEELDESRSYQPDLKISLYNIYLRLSDVPPGEWREIFEAERRFPRHTTWRRAWIENDCIVVHCVPDELERFHLRDLREDAANANRKYREYLVRKAQTTVSKDNAMKHLKEKLKL